MQLVDGKKKRRKGKGSGDTTTCAMMYYVDRNLSLTNVVGGAAAARGNRAKWTRFFFSYYTQHFSSFLRIHCRVFSPALCRSPAGRNIRNTAETLSLLMNTQKKRVIYRSSSFLYRSTKFGVKRISLCMCPAPVLYTTHRYACGGFIRTASDTQARLMTSTVLPLQIFIFCSDDVSL